MHRLALAATAALLLAGCGTAKKPATKIVNGHQCTPNDEAAQCLLPPPGLLPRLSLAPVVARGVDFAWGAPTVAGMRAFGASFGASYFSYDTAKGWQQRANLVASYHAAGIATVGVWETSANRAAQGCSAGRSDALEASRQARAVGNTSRPIDFAIDFDASGGQVADYFRCAHSVLGSRTGAYGGYTPLAYLCAHGLVGHTNWQTYAWSGGSWLPASCAPLEQWLNGNAVDYDRAIAADYGQWPGPARPKPKPTPKPSRSALLRLRGELRRDLTRRRCRVAPYHGRGKYHAVCKHWLAYGDQVNRELRGAR